MYEKVTPAHPDKIADRIAGAIVDKAYKIDEDISNIYKYDPKIAVEVLIGHDICNIMIESDVHFNRYDIDKIVHRIVGSDKICIHIYQFLQDKHLADNQKDKIRCGDNGIFKGCPITIEQKQLTYLVQDLYKNFPYDGKYILDKKYSDRLICCQSHMGEGEYKLVGHNITVNPLGYWEGGINVDCGATNRKLGSDMGDAVTGGGLHGKDLSKADVSVNIYLHNSAQIKNKNEEYSCAIGDEKIMGKPYSEIVKHAKDYIVSIGGFEKFAEWGLIR